MSSRLDECRLVELPSRKDARGDLTFLEGERHVPFALERLFYLYGVSEGATRGGHAHKTLKQFVIALSGSFEVVIEDGIGKKTFLMDRPDRGLYVAPMIWAELRSFSRGAVAAVLASARYDESDYVREYDDYRRAVRGTA